MNRTKISLLVHLEANGAFNASLFRIKELTLLQIGGAIKCMVKSRLEGDDESLQPTFYTTTAFFSSTYFTIQVSI